MILGFLAFVAFTSADKSLEQSQYNGGSAGGGAGGVGGSSFSGGAVGFGGGAVAFAGGDEGFNNLNPVGGALEETVPGIPGDDYPIFSDVPETSFLCDGQVDGGYYADPEAECQAFHICSNDGNEGLTKYSFLCPNGTLFNQQYFVCDWWFNVDCSTAEQFYSLNDVIAAEREASSPAGDVGGGEYQGKAKGQAGGSRKGSGTSSGRKGSDSASRDSASQASASSPTGSYSSPDAFVSLPIFK